MLSSQLTHTLSILNAPKCVLQYLDKVRKRFLWARGENLIGGKCKVNWLMVTRPINLDSLGMLDLERFARAL
jgi:hypothetical protein